MSPFTISMVIWSPCWMEITKFHKETDMVERSWPLSWLWQSNLWKTAADIPLLFFWPQKSVFQYSEHDTSNIIKRQIFRFILLFFITVCHWCFLYNLMWQNYLIQYFSFSLWISKILYDWNSFPSVFIFCFCSF